MLMPSDYVKAADSPPSSSEYAFYAGRFTEDKGVHTLLEAWQHVRFPLKLAGFGPLERDARALARQRPDVEVLGRLDHADVLQLLSKAAFCVFPSRWYETFGRVIIEAFAAGRPVVASNLGAMACLVRDGVTGLLFRPGDAEDLARKVNGLISNPVRLSELGASARREYEEMYTPERNYGMLMSILQEAMANAH